MADLKTGEGCLPSNECPCTCHNTGGMNTAHLVPCCGMTRPVIADHPHTDPGDGRTECQTCGKWVFEVIHSCKRVPVTAAAWNRKLDDLIEQWHTSPTDDGPLHTFLGMSWDEYCAWVSDSNAIPARWL